MKNLIIVSTLLLLASCAGSGSAAAVKPYTSKDCVVTDNELGSMGEVITRVYGNQEVKFCCKPCIKKFEKDPEKYLSKLKEE
ncbi:MAG: hypothetical protein RL095_1427 [Verrucomicrobiota bacterium]|jgi:hypothetical protein